MGGWVSYFLLPLLTTLGDLAPPCGTSLAMQTAIMVSDQNTCFSNSGRLHSATFLSVSDKYDPLCFPDNSKVLIFAKKNVRDLNRLMVH